MMMPSLVVLTFGMRCIPKVLGFVACQTTSKHLGIGSVEWSWSDVMTIKNGKRANIGGECLEKRAILYTSAKLEEAHFKEIWILLMTLTTMCLVMMILSKYLF